MFAKSQTKTVNGLVSCTKMGQRQQLERRETLHSIRSGSVEGYVLTDQLYTGGQPKSMLYRRHRAGDCYGLRCECAKGQGTEYEILTQITKDQTYQVTGEAVDGWYPIRAGETDGWVSGEYVTVTDSFTYAESREEEQARIAAEEAQRKRKS